MPPSRRSIIPLQQQQDDSTVTVQHNALDDARKVRRERVQSRKSLGETPAARGKQQTVSRENVKERREHYMACMKLAQCNKIDARNAFSLELIEGLSYLIKNSDDMNFGLATTALDAGTKIYVNRVDCVYTDAQKVSNGLVQSMQNKGKGRSDEDGDEEDTPLDDQDPEAPNVNDTLVPKQRKKGIAKRTGKTLATSIATLDIDKLATNTEVDPLFHKINTSHDIGNVNSMFLANLDLDSTGAFILDANAKTEVLSPSTDPLSEQSTGPIQTNDLCEKFRSFCEKPGRIFGEKFFLNFTFNRNSSLEMTDLETTGRFEDTATQPHPSKYAFDLNAAPIECENFAPPDFNLSYEDDLEPMSDDDDDPEDGNRQKANVNKSIITTNNINSLGDLKSLLANSSEYSYFAKNINVVGSWAGPGYWKPNVWAKLRQRQEERLREAGQEETAGRAKRATKKKEFEPIDFKSCQDYQLDPSKKNTYTLTTLTKWKSCGDSLTLPRTVLFDPESQLKMTLKPNSFYSFLDKGHSKATSKVPSQDAGHSVSAISSPPPDTGFDVDDDIPFPPESQPMPEGFLPTQDVEMEAGFTGNNLIDAPDPLNQIVLPYAKHAKRMDVKKLKKEMLELIKCPTSPDNSLSAGATSSPESLHAIQFKQLYSLLPSKLSTTMAKDMSPQIAFVTLLHLANENNLKLHSLMKETSSLPDDITIEREEVTSE